MGTSVVRYASSALSGFSWGVVRGSHVAEVGGEFKTLADIIENGRDALFEAIDARLPLSALQLLSPVTGPARLICLGRNYPRVVNDTPASREIEDKLFVLKDFSALSGPNDDILRPQECRLLDYEIELGLVLGRQIIGETRITRGNLGDYIAGLVICNDVSARDIMLGGSHMQWYRGKSFRTFCPTGPILYLLDRSDIDLLLNLELKLWLNGELMQQANTSHMIHAIEDILTELSRVIDLEVGDCLLTGSPPGSIASHTDITRRALCDLYFDDLVRRETIVADQLGHADYLKDGDELRLSISSSDGSIDLGTQMCKVRAI